MVADPKLGQTSLGKGVLIRLLGRPCCLRTCDIPLEYNENPKNCQYDPLYAFLSKVLSKESVIRVLVNQDTIQKTKAPQNAGQNPATSNPGTNFEASQNINALITNENNPSVKMVSGSDNTSTNGRIKAFTSPITTAAINALGKELTETPGTKYATTITANAFKNKRTSKSIKVVSLVF